MKTLRTDQAAAIDNLRAAYADRERRMVLQAPTGFGKTVVAADIIRAAREKDKRAMITVPALSLVDQTVKALYAHGVTEIGVIQADHRMTDASKPVQVASVQTLLSWARTGSESESIEDHYNLAKLPQVDLVVVDEVHKWFKLFEVWFASEAWRRIPIIGMSATPWLEGLGRWFDRLIVGNMIGQMIAEKSLAPFRVFAAGHPDLEGVRVRRNGSGERDYVEGDLVERMNKPKLVADVVQSWFSFAKERPSICFAVNRDHAAQLAREFEAAGVSSGYMDCETPVLERNALRRRFQRGDVQVVCNVDVIGLGVDWPEVSCIIYARPTQSEMRYVQNVGRGLRIADGKEDLVVIDHSDTTLRLGFVSDIHHPELDDGEPKINGHAPLVERPNECPKCHYIKPARQPKCSNCGHVAEHHAKPIAVANGTLKELKPEDVNKEAPVAKRLGLDMNSKAKVYGQLLWYARKKGHRDGWAIVKYKLIYGVLPWPVINNNSWRGHFREPEMELASWIKSQNIKFAKSRSNGNRWRDDGVQDDRPPKGAVATVDSLMREDDWDELR